MQRTSTNQMRMKRERKKYVFLASTSNLRYIFFLFFFSILFLCVLNFLCAWKHFFFFHAAYRILYGLGTKMLTEWFACPSTYIQRMFLTLSEHGACGFLFLFHVYTCEAWTWTNVNCSGQTFPMVLTNSNLLKNNYSQIRSLMIAMFLIIAPKWRTLTGSKLCSPNVEKHRHRPNRSGFFSPFSSFHKYISSLNGEKISIKSALNFQCNHPKKNSK